MNNSAKFKMAFETTSIVLLASALACCLVMIYLIGSNQAEEAIRLTLGNTEQIASGKYLDAQTDARTTFIKAAACLIVAIAAFGFGVLLRVIVVYHTQSPTQLLNQGTHKRTPDKVRAARLVAHPGRWNASTHNFRNDYEQDPDP